METVHDYALFPHKYQQFNVQRMRSDARKKFVLVHSYRKTTTVTTTIKVIATLYTKKSTLRRTTSKKVNRKTNKQTSLL